MAHPFSERISGTKQYYNFIRKVAFPSTKAILVMNLAYSTLGLAISFLIARQNLSSFVLGAFWGVIVLTIPSFASATLTYQIVTRYDPLFYLRRCLALSLFTNIIWVFVFLVSSLVALTTHAFSFPTYAFVLGLFVVMPLRAVTVFSMSTTSFVRRTIFTLFEPTVTTLLALWLFELPLVKLVTGLILSSLVGLMFAFGLVAFIETYGRSTIGFSPLRMFKAFLTDWLEGKNDELESYLSELGVHTEISLAAFAFRRKSTKEVKAVILVSNFHPGPFMNIGSSVLPFLFQRVVSARLKAVGVVPHGVSGHELNLVSQGQNARIIEWAVTNLHNLHYSALATPVTRTKNEIATATSQIFDGCAIVTMTTAPNDMEDVPSEIQSRITGLMKGTFRHVGLIDAHNCLSGPTTMTAEKIGGLEDAVLSSLQVSAEQSTNEFKVGASTGKPANFSLKDGFGPGGISTIAVEVNGQRFAYINLDGNNMTKGLRELIIERTRKVGFEDCEVMTTDTHMVNGIVSARLGYHPIGEAVATQEVLDSVESVCRAAFDDLEPCEAGVISQQMLVTTLGSKSLRGVMGLVHKISRTTAVLMFGIILLIAALTLLFLV